ncbi:sugar ABC transporter permease [Halorubrum ezzemoulense]|uniref:Sugar ABC transporter permease n=1 Tax=Halorubrum ezzemoulense TaxID=337243 RepID=A0A256J739_HALEZ|nr:MULTISPECIES: carbohydrate ABC transporter permease [Halorubrum]MDB2225230.1 carbohydrate ABC transporter permease [Halorubrum ezzemoulense]MDB2241934.1 carbohydrate ABC transporter permease [Halorubrum ezzemoulense]MDB2270879.1 carbohydrate ABC transporter permease [Halorubrum ezzemoulense]OYR64595.1 sugar ABC transporter permease [Halorubrum ezzemoulense]OYR75997.1 sugar ABC transporter permease [Halorubrum ezzemoulense]
MSDGATDGGTAAEPDPTADIAEQARTEEPDLDRGLIEAWAARMISNPDLAYRATFYVATIFFLVTTLFPFYWLFVLAVTPRNNLSEVGVFLPAGFNPAAFLEIFTTLPFHRYVFNSFLIATIATVAVLFVGSLAGYVFGRLDFRGRNPLLLLVLVTSFFPPAAFFIPLNRLFNTNVDVLRPLLSSGSLYNTPYAIFIPLSAIFLPLSIFILMTFYSQIPDGLEDAARVEGTTRIGALFRVIVPLSAPGVATAGVLTFISVYNEYFFSSLMTDGRPGSWAPMLEGILRFQGEFEVLYNLMAAASIVAVLPVAILVVVAQEKIVSGLTTGAVKE